MKENQIDPKIESIKTTWAERFQSSKRAQAGTKDALDNRQSLLDSEANCLLIKNKITSQQGEQGRDTQNTQIIESELGLSQNASSSSIIEGLSQIYKRNKCLVIKGSLYWICQGLTCIYLHIRSIYIVSGDKTLSINHFELARCAKIDFYTLQNTFPVQQSFKSVELFLYYHTQPICLQMKSCESLKENNSQILQKIDEAFRSSSKIKEELMILSETFRSRSLDKVLECLD